MIELVNISKTFYDGNSAELLLFDNLNFKVNRADFVSLVGSNGSGKTTLLNLITGTVLADKGQILLDGCDITHKKEYQRARRIGRVFQNTSDGVAGAMTVAENMSLAENKGRAYGLSRSLSNKSKERYKELLSTLGLGLEDKLDTKISSLSGGQRQALSLLMATMTPIDILVLDEHTSALDPKTAEEIMRLTDRIIKEKGLTAIMVTHNLRSAVEYGNRLCMMKEGRVELDLSGEEKNKISVSDVMHFFNN
jgi:putative ABC transport system ATP-binding protein